MRIWENLFFIHFWHLVEFLDFYFNAVLSSGQGEESDQSGSTDKLQNTTVFQEQPTRSQLPLSHIREFSKMWKFKVISSWSAAAWVTPRSRLIRMNLRGRVQIRAELSLKGAQMANRELNCWLTGSAACPLIQSSPGHLKMVIESLGIVFSAKWLGTRRYYHRGPEFHKVHAYEPRSVGYKYHIVGLNWYFSRGWPATERME